MFVRENRKQKLSPSGFEYKPVKEWELYRNMMFLLPHIAHRRTKSLYIPNQSICSPSQTTSSPKVNNLLPFKESVNLVHSLPSYDHDYSEPNKFVEDNEQLINEDSVITIDHEPIKRPASTMSTCSSISSIQFSEATINGMPAIKDCTTNANTCSTSFMDMPYWGFAITSMGGGMTRGTWLSADRARHAPLFQNVLHQSSSSCCRDRRTSAVTNDHREKNDLFFYYKLF